MPGINNNIRQKQHFLQKSETESIKTGNKQTKPSKKTGTITDTIYIPALRPYIRPAHLYRLAGRMHGRAPRLQKVRHPGNKHRQDKKE